MTNFATPGRSFTSHIDLISGRQVLAQLNYEAASDSLRQIIHLQDSLLAAPPEGDQYLLLLEEIRLPLRDVVERVIGQFADRLLPLSAQEEEYFHLVVMAYRRMSNAYQQLTEMLAVQKHEPWYPYRMAVLLQRIMFYTASVAQAHFLGRRELPAGLWVEMHAAYSQAESLGVTLNRVDDALEPHRQASCCATVYVATQLLELASPYSLSLAHLRLIIRWTALWGHLVTVADVIPGSQLPPRLIDLSSDSALVVTDNTTKPTPFIRFLNTTQLDLEIRRTLQRLKEGTPPARLGLGDEAPVHIVRLVGRIARPWAQLIIPRRFRRMAAQGTLELIQGFEGIHYQLSGLDFSTVQSSLVYGREIYETRRSLWFEIEPNGKHVGGRGEYAPDAWTMLDQSLGGYRLVRSIEGKRIGQGQLVAVREINTGTWSLAQIRFLMEENRGSLVAGTSLFPGVPEPIALTLQVNDPKVRSDYFRAFILPPVGDQEASMVVPLGTYYPSRFCKMRRGPVVQEIIIKSLIEKGTDFERVGFVLN